ncbi:MAG: hypothetical protein CEN90_211 [Parcubacteria group bacterium Licking1014_17]|nr:MAG: hypothetical protein CEN90_211 [Parcubacteria group bacterium Licking1014_17]
MRKLLVVSLVIFVFAIAGSVSASTITGINGGSTGKIFNSFFVGVFLDNNNKATITNTVTSSSGSGNNTVTSAGEQRATSVTTGDTTAATMVTNEANETTAAVAVESASTTDDAISNVSDGSDAKIKNEDEVKIDLDNKNDIKNTNAIAAIATTGSNAVISGDKLRDTVMKTGIAQTATGLANLFNISAFTITRTIK